MNRYKLYQAGIHIQDGLERFSGDETLYREMLSEFVKDSYYEKLCAAVAAGEAEAAFQAAHALKGETGNLAISEMYEALKPLVEDLRHGEMAHADALLQPVSRAYEKAVAELKAEGFALAQA